MMYPDKPRVVATMLELLHARAAGATICPSEVARAVDPLHWRPLMPVVRDIAAELVDKGVIEVRQRGHVIELTSETRGPIRLAFRAGRHHGQ